MKNLNTNLSLRPRFSVGSNLSEPYPNMRLTKKSNKLPEFNFWHVIPHSDAESLEILNQVQDDVIIFSQPQELLPITAEDDASASGEKKRVSSKLSNMHKILILFFTLFLLPLTTQAQYFNVFDIDTSDYPTMRAKFYSIDENGNQLLNHTPADFEITENGEQREVVDVSCPVLKSEPASVVLAIDVSGSMSGNRIELAKEAARSWVRGMPENGSECAIISFNSKNNFIQDFTSNKNRLLSRINYLNSDGGTSFDAAFTDKMAGSLLTIKKSKNNVKAIILISDGVADGDEVEIIKTANSQNAIVFSVTLNMKCPEILKNISETTKGEWYENVTTIPQAKEVFKTLSQKIQKENPCEIVWESDYLCSKDIKVEFQNKVINKSSNNSYLIKESLIAGLIIEPSFINFGEVEPGTTKDTVIQVTSRNIEVEINDIKLSNGNDIYKINKTFPIILEKDKPKQISITYQPIDSSRYYATCLIEADYCDSEFSLFGGFINKPLSLRTLELTHPNGGEVFYAGSDTAITWEGISKNDTVSLEFSSNNGKDWEKLTDMAKGNEYNWQVPNIVSDKCLIRIKQINSAAIKKEGDLDWQKSYGGSDGESSSSIHQTLDGGYIIAGSSGSTDGDITDFKGSSDYWLIKLRTSGDLDWQKSYGGNKAEIANSVQQTLNSGYIIAGYSRSDNDDVSENIGIDDFWIVNLRNDGNIVWEKSFGGNYYDRANSIKQTNDGGYIIAGMSMSNDGDITDPKGKWDYWIVKLEPNGDIDWQKSYGGSEDEIAYTIHQTYDEGFIIAGGSNSTDGDITDSKGKWDYWIVKLEPNGDIDWQKSYGGSEDEKAYTIHQTYDEGFIVAGGSNSTDGDITDPKGERDYWIVKLEPNGDIEWQKSYGGSDDDLAKSILQTFDGGYIVVGASKSLDDDITNNKGKYDYWVLKLEPNGDIEWQKSYGGSDGEIANSVQQTNDGGYIIAGGSSSTDGDITDPKGDSDFWILKLAGENILQSDTSDAVFSIIAPEPRIQNNDIDLGQMVVGKTKDTIVTKLLCNDGEAPLHVLGVDITSGDDSEFLIPRGAGEFTLNEGECQDFMFEFTPSQVGERVAYATIRTTIGDFQDTIRIRGEGILPRLEVETELINFGEVLVDNSKDSLVEGVITNTGSTTIDITGLEFAGPNKSDFFLTSGSADTTFALEPDESSTFNFTFRPSDEGRTSCILEVKHKDQIAPVDVQLFGTGTIEPDFVILADTIDFGKVLVSESKDSLVEDIFVSLSGKSFYCEGINFKGQNPSNFFLTSGSLDTTFTLDHDDTFTTNLSFSPNRVGPFSAKLEFQYENIKEPLEVVLLGNGYIETNYLTVIEADNIEAETRDRVEFQLSISEMEIDYEKAAANWEATLEYNGSIMHIEGENCSNDLICTKDISGTWDKESEELIKLQADIMLGNVEKDDIKIKEFKWLNDSLDTQIETRDGSLRILDICYEGGTRLINPNGEVSLDPLAPNMANNQTEIRFETIESGHTKLEVYNFLGSKVATIINGDIEPGRREMTLDLSDFATGRYYIQLSTPTVTKTEILEVVK